MTDHDLRDLLHEQVADVTATSDLSAGAWATARGVRRRRAVGLVTGVAAVAVLVVAGITIVGDGSNRTPDPAPNPAPTPAQTPDAGELETSPDGTFRGASVYWSPSLDEEADLPLMTEGRPPLPEVIDLSAEATPVEDDPIDRAVAAFGVVDDSSTVRMLLLASDGSYRSLDLSGVGPDPTISCCQRPALFDEMLSPTGEYVVFPQASGVMVYDLPRNEWRTIPTGMVDPFHATWLGDRELYDPKYTGGAGPTFDVVTGERTGEGVTADLGANDLGLERDSSYRFGPARNGPGGELQSWGSGAAMPVQPGTPRKPELVVATAFPTVILSITGSPGGDERWLQCCPVVGWANNHVAMYESRSSTSPRIIGWTVGSHRFETVATITGFTPGVNSFVGSYAKYWG